VTVELDCGKHIAQARLAVQRNAFVCSEQALGVYLRLADVQTLCFFN
jgi:hypothetical protein